MSRENPTYDETYAHALLTRVAGLKNIELFDKPDIISQDHTLGIEVVSAISENEHRFDEIMYRRHNGKKADPLPEGYEENRWCISHPCLTSEDNDKFVGIAKKRILKKVEKSKDYAKVNSMCLFITIDLVGSRNEILKQICEDLYRNTDHNFDSIYFHIRNENKLIVCSCRSNSTVYDFQDTQGEIAKYAAAVATRRMSFSTPSFLLPRGDV